MAGRERPDVTLRASRHANLAQERALLGEDETLLLGELEVRHASSSARSRAR